MEALEVGLEADFRPRILAPVFDDRLTLLGHVVAVNLVRAFVKYDTHFRGMHSCSAYMPA